MQPYNHILINRFMIQYGFTCKVNPKCILYLQHLRIFYLIIDINLSCNKQMYVADNSSVTVLGRADACFHRTVSQ